MVTPKSRATAAAVATAVGALGSAHAAVFRSPTLGALQRLSGDTDAARRRRVRWLIACEMVAELRRQAAVEEWAAVGLALQRGWPPCQLARRMRRLADQLDPPAEQETTP